MTSKGEPAAPDELWMDRAIVRIWKLMWAIGVGGAIALLVWRGWWWGAGWVFGSALSALNFRWLKQMADGVGSETAKPRKAVFLGMRWILLGSGLYAILKYSAISVPAALAGLFLSTAAVMVEILFELLMYARNGTVDH
jgi:ATP synthase I chain